MQAGAVLLATDGSGEASLAARTAAELAGKTGSGLHVVRVEEFPVPPFYYRPHEEVETAARRRCEELVGRIEGAGARVERVHSRLGQPEKEIVALAEELGAGMVVVGSRGLGRLRRALIGSVSHFVATHAHCPVLVVRREGRVAGEVGAEAEDEATGERSAEMGILPTKILAATDGSGVATFAVDAAAELAHKTGSELHLAYVLPMTVVYSTADVVLAGGVPLYDKVRREGEELLAGHARRAEEAGAAVAETHFLEGEPDAEIVGLGERLGAGLIVVGNRGLGPLARTLLGSVSDSVVRHAHCPVLVVRRENG